MPSKLTRFSSSQILIGGLFMIASFTYLIYHYIDVIGKIVTSQIATKESSESSKSKVSTSVVSSEINDQDIRYNSCIFGEIGNGAFLLPQWIDYHTVAGIDHFYLVNKCDNDSEKKSYWLQKYESQGLITQSLYGSKQCSDKPSQKNYKSDELYQLYKVAIKSCDWIIHLDIDEYLNPSNDGQGRRSRTATGSELLFLNTWLLNSTQTEYRLPSYTISSHMLEDHQSGLIIDNYVNGVFSKDVKLFLRTDHLETYEKQFESSHKKGDNKPISTLFHTNIREGELVSISAEKSSCLIPTSPLYIKHYSALSLEDYMKISTDANKSKEKWMKYHIKRRCPLLNEPIRKGMSKQMLDQLRKNIPHFCGGNYNSSIPFDAHVNSWLEANPISC